MRLTYALDDRPGITRQRKGRGFSYRWPDGRRVTEPEVLARIRRLAIPPAYVRVWISPTAHAHLQATGLDAKGRKQYRYHPEWRVKQDQTKFHRLTQFGRSLPRVRSRVSRDLCDPALSKKRVVAAVVRLIDTTHGRVGSERYARENGSFGITTLRKQHARLAGAAIQLSYRAKSGKRQEAAVRSRNLARIIRACGELPGHRLFQFTDEAGRCHSIRSTDVNAYLKSVTGAAFSAKDFRTWIGTRAAARWLAAQPKPDTQKARRHLAAACFRHVADVLGNTPAVCRKSYVHPGLLAVFEAGDLPPAFGEPRLPARQVDRLLLSLLRRLDGAATGNA